MEKYTPPHLGERQKKLPDPDELELAALADFLRSDRLAPQAQRMLCFLPLAFSSRGNKVSVEKFELVLANGKFSKAERTWFPNWWLRFREQMQVPRT